MSHVGLGIVESDYRPRCKIVAKIKKGEDYLRPDIEIIADDALPDDEKKELEYFLKS